MNKKSITFPLILMIIGIILVFIILFKYRYFGELSIIKENFVKMPNVEQNGYISCSNNNICQDFINKYGYSGETRCNEGFCEMNIPLGGISRE